MGIPAGATWAGVLGYGALDGAANGFLEQFLLNLLRCHDWNEGILNTTASGAIAGAATAGFFHGSRQLASRAMQAIDNSISLPTPLNPQNNPLPSGSNIDDLASGATNWRGYEFRSPNPDFPPNQGALAKMQSVNFQGFCANGNTDCSEIALSLYKASGWQGSVLHIEPNVQQYLSPKLKVPEAGGVLKTTFTTTFIQMVDMCLIRDYRLTPLYH